MRRTFWQLLGTEEFADADGTADRPCYGIFPAEDVARDVAEYFATVDLWVDVVPVDADWERAVAG